MHVVAEFLGPPQRLQVENEFPAAGCATFGKPSSKSARGIQQQPKAVAVHRLDPGYARSEAMSDNNADILLLEEIVYFVDQRLWISPSGLDDPLEPTAKLFLIPAVIFDLVRADF